MLLALNLAFCPFVIICICLFSFWLWLDSGGARLEPAETGPSSEQHWLSHWEPREDIRHSHADNIQSLDSWSIRFSKHGNECSFESLVKRKFWAWDVLGNVLGNEVWIKNPLYFSILYKYFRNVFYCQLRSCSSAAVLLWHESPPDWAQGHHTSIYQCSHCLSTLICF